MKVSFRNIAKSVTVAGLAGAILGCAAAGNAGEPGDSAALTQALDDEYRAEATYLAVLDAYGDVRPFINIIQAEQRHSSRVKMEMDRLGLGYEDANPYLGTIAAPPSLLAACSQGITAERENIALYDRILPSVSDKQAKATLEQLQWASRERHLPAFERCVARGGMMGRGGLPF